MKVKEIEWDAANQAHFAEHGRCSKAHVEDVITARRYPSRASAVNADHLEKRFRFEGQTGSGRFLVVIASHIGAGVFRPITCWPLSGERLDSYLRWRQTIKR